MGEAAPQELTVDFVYEKLEQLMPAIAALGGSIRVASAVRSPGESGRAVGGAACDLDAVRCAPFPLELRPSRRLQEDGVATLEYSGPPKVKFGIEMALKDEPLIKEIVFS